MPYRFVIIGCGRIAGRHAQLAARQGILQAVCDILPERAEALAQAYGAKAYTDVNTLLTECQPDIAVICSPNGLHDEHALQALAAGCHVLCEKPMTLTLERGRRMVEAARAAGRKLFVVKQNRFNPPVQAVKALLDQGKLGPLLSFQLNCFWNRPPAYYQDTWKGSLDMDGGTLYTQFSHFIDLLYWFLGDVKAIQGQRENRSHRGVIEFEDQGMVLLELESGLKGSLQYSVNSYRKNMEGSITLFGEKGTVKIGGQYLNRLDHFEVEGETAPELPQAAGANQYGFYEGSMSNHDKVYAQLLQELASPQHQLVEAEEALRTVDIIERIYKACQLE